MLQAEEVDDDYFTPVAGTSLASIFGNAPIKQNSENDSLKYTPPKSQDIQKKPKEEKASQCVFACALIGHEWVNNSYTSRGKLGFAILKIQNTGDHNIILYDSNKTTLSSTTVSHKLELSIKNDSYISYYDNQQKYWSIYAGQEETKRIIEVLTSFGVTLQYSTFTDTGPPEPIKTEDNLDTPTEYNVESDSSANRKTKASILYRMANMGHSVFPYQSSKTIDKGNKTSDSSDTNETDVHPKILKHKAKNTPKRHKDLESNTGHQVESHNMSDLPINEEKSIQLSTPPSRQLLPSTTNIYASPSSNLSNEMGMYMTEQRMSNSELRINMNRISDKLDKVLNKVENSERQSADVQTEILLKLLNEYEKKIKMYENTMNFGDTVLNLESRSIAEVDLLKKKIQELEVDNKSKSDEIFSLHKEMKELKFKCTEGETSQAKREESFVKRINELENTLAIRNELNTVYKSNSEQSSDVASESNMGAKLKNIMNDTYQAIAVNFENGETYSGEIIRKVIGSVIKKITIQTLCDIS